MTNQVVLTRGVSIFGEIQEFAGFSIESKHYIRRSIDVASGDAQAIERWSNGPQDRDAIRAQAHIYRSLVPLRTRVEEGLSKGRHSEFLPLLIELSAFDLDSGDLDGFPPYRFLYERLLGSRVRPWLPSAFCAVAVMPQMKPIRRIGLLSTLGEAIVARWSQQEPSFHPEQIEA
jgi:hypothetical protein